MLGNFDNEQRWRRINELHLNVTSACNFRCSYCYANADAVGRGRNMPVEIACTAVDEVLSQTAATNVKIIFHGGEPLLQPDQFYETVCYHTVMRAKERSINLMFGMQTNLSLLSEVKASLLSKYGVKIGTSIDGPEAIHNSLRGSYFSVLRGMEIARRYGIFCGPIVVVNRHNFKNMQDVLDNFISLDIKSLHCNIGAAIGRGFQEFQRLNPEEIFIAYCDIFDHMLTRDFAVVDTNLLMMIERLIYRRHSRDRFLLTCHTPFCQAGIKMICVDVDGSVYPCGCASANAALMPFRISKIGDVSKYDHEKLLKFHAKPDTYGSICAKCPARFLCSHGCPAFDAMDPETGAAICRATRIFHDFLCDRPKEIQRYQLYFNKVGIN